LKQSVAVVSFGPTGFIFTRIQPVGPVLLDGLLRGWAEVRLIPVEISQSDWAISAKCFPMGGFMAFSQLEQDVLAAHEVAIFEDRIILDARPPIDDETLTRIQARCTGPK
jgi:hypothetical protein